MEYGIFTSKFLEIAHTNNWTLCFYCNSDKTLIGTRLYYGNYGEYKDKRLVSICEYSNGSIKFSFKSLADGQNGHTNDPDGVHKYIDSLYIHDVTELRKIENIEIIDQATMPTVSEASIAVCLKLWRMGTAYIPHPDGFTFRFITNNVEYVFSIYNAASSETVDIYCGAYVYITTNTGLIGIMSYFRIRHFSEKSGYSGQYGCNLDNDIEFTHIDIHDLCKNKTWTQTSNANFWAVKRQSDNEIVLDGCGGDEYIYRQDNFRSEFFMDCPN